MGSAMPEADTPIIAPRRPDAQAEARQLRVPDTIIRSTERQLSPREIAVEIDQLTGPLPGGDRKATIES